MTKHRILLGVIVSVILFVVAQVGLGIYIDRVAEAKDVSWTIGATYFSYVVAGYVAGVIATDKHFLLGMLVGINCALLDILLFATAGTGQASMILLILGIIFGGLGGLLSKSDMHSRRKPG